MLTTSGVAAAQSFGERGQLIVSAGPILNLSQTKATVKYDTSAGDYELERTENKFGFLDTGEGKAGFITRSRRRSR